MKALKFVCDHCGVTWYASHATDGSCNGGNHGGGRDAQPMEDEDDPGKVDVRPTVANCTDCGAEHDVDTMTLLAGDVDTYICNACENERERPKYINVYRVTRHYGGPEEGGWWYDAGAPLASVPIMDGTDTEATREQLAAHFASEACGDIGSVLGGAEVHVTLEPHMATSYPATRPHYE